MYKLIRPLLFTIKPEKAHEMVMKLGGFFEKHPMLLGYLGLQNKTYHSQLQQTIWGQYFSNPVGLAAGYDKNAELVPFLEALGFGFIEVGSLTFMPSQGNPGPRLFRLPQERAIINRMGLNNVGAQQGRQNLIKTKSQVPLGVNIAKTHDPTIVGHKAVEDFIESYELLSDQGDYHTINISCPNTTEGKTFEQDPVALRELLHEIMTRKKNRPVLVKMSPDLSDHGLEDLLRHIEDFKIDGLVISNTTNDRQMLKTSSETLSQMGRGGLSGRPLRQKSNILIAKTYKLTKGRIPIIGVGGVFTAQDALDKFMYGASLVQVYSGLIYQGPAIVRNINNHLVTLLKNSGYQHLCECIGTKSLP